MPTIHLVLTLPPTAARQITCVRAQHWVSQISYLPDLRLLSIGTHTFFGVSENGCANFLACLTVRG